MTPTETLHRSLVSTEYRTLSYVTGPLVFAFNHNREPTRTTLTLPPGNATNLLSGERVASLRTPMRHHHER